MYEMLKKKDRKNAFFQNTKSVNNLYIERDSRSGQQHNINELRIQYKTVLDKDNSINRKVVQMKLYNSKKKSKPVNNLDDLNAYIKDILCGHINIEYGMFDVEPEIVDAAIQELDSSCVSEENIKQVIEDKIHDLIERRETKRQMEENEEKERLKTVSIKLKNMFQERIIKGQKGFFVGDESKWHIHAGIKDVHLKFGNGNRWDINSKNERSIKDAVSALVCTGITGKDKKQCYCWLRYKMIEWFDKDLPVEQRFYV